MHGLRKIRQILHQEIVFGRRARDAERIGFLKRVATDQLAGYWPLAPRSGWNPSWVDQTGNQVGRAGPEVAQHTPTFPVARA